VLRREQEFHSLLQRLLSVFTIVHVHANNFAAVERGFPEVIEISFARVNGSSTRRVRSLPRLGLDFPNNPSKPDVVMTF
jgi:hypothetical protein